MAVIAIGDVHGHLAPLKDLTAQILPILSSKDVLVFLGDYIDKGPEVRRCIDHILELESECPCPMVALAGNHEYQMIRTWSDPTDHSWIWFGGLDTVESYSIAAAAEIRREIEEAGPRMVTSRIPINYQVFFDSLPAAHRAFFTRLRNWYETEDVICVHAGFDPTVESIEDQNPETLVWGIDCFPSEYRGARTVVYGHWDNSICDDCGWPLPRVLNERTFGIDTISKGVLSAMRFPDRRLFQSERYTA